MHIHVLPPSLPPLKFLNKRSGEVTLSKTEEQDAAVTCPEDLVEDSQISYRQQWFLYLDFK